MESKMIVTKLKSGTPFTLNGTAVWIDHDLENGMVSIRYCSNKYPVSKTDLVSIEDLTPVLKVRAEINKVSETRAKENKIYLTLRKVFLDNHPNCEANLPGCSKQSTTVHHSAGRIGKRLIDVTSFVALCGSCHTFCELNPDWAKENGYSLIRL